MRDLLAGALVTLVVVWAAGWTWGWAQRRRATRERLSPQWLTEHEARQWK
jgi:hypothetical protein